MLNVWILHKIWYNNEIIKSEVFVLSDKGTLLVRIKFLSLTVTKTILKS